MREGTLIPTNLLNWPRIAPMLPELKLLVLALWSSPHMSCAGCGLVPLRPFSSTLGLSAESTQTGLEILEKAGLIVTDQQTGEIFIRDWFRFHKFPTGKSYGMLLNSVEKIESAQLKELVRSCLPAAPAYINKPISKPGNGGAAGRQVDEATGVLLMDESDRERISALVKNHGADRVKSAADGIRADGGRPFVSLVYSVLKTVLKTQNQQQRDGIDYAGMGRINPNNPSREKF